MIDILVYTDGSSLADKAVEFAVTFQKRLKARLAFITIRKGTSAGETPPPIGEPVPFEAGEQLPDGIRALMTTARKAVAQGILAPFDQVQIREITNGHLFVCQASDGSRVPFYECFGHFVDILNHKIDQNQYKLFIIAIPPPSRLKRVLAQSTTRKLALDLHTSLLVVRSGGPDSRYLVCADGSPSARRQFPLLKYLLPAVSHPVDLAWFKPPKAEPATVEAAKHCLDLASDWLQTENKLGRIHHLSGSSRLEAILEAAGDRSVICMGASLRHDVYRRMKGSLPLQILGQTKSSVLLAKLPPEADRELFQKPFKC